MVRMETTRDAQPLHRTRWATSVGLTLCVLCAWAVASVGAAQIDDVTVVMVSSSDGPSVGEEFQVQIEARQTSGQPGLLEEPPFAPFRVVGSTGVRRMQSVRQTFGSPPQIEIRTVVGYTLVADAPGTFTIPGAVYRTGRRNIASAPLVLKVGGVAANSGAVAAPSGTEASVGAFDSNVFLRATVDRTNPYVGQQVTYTLYMYVRVPGTPSLSQQPTTSDFWVVDLLSPRRTPSPELQVVQGLQFEVHVLRRLALFPSQAGSLDIGGATLEYDVSGPIDVFQGNRQVLRRESPPIRIETRALPGNPAAGVIVGRIAMNATLDRADTHTGQAVTFSVVVHGDGLLRDAALTPPTIPGLRFEAPTMNERVETPSDLVGGERRFSWQVVALRAGSYRIPRMTLDVFDPTTGRMERATTQELELRATGPDVVEDPVDEASSDDGDEADNVPSEDAIHFGPPYRQSAMRRRSLPLHARGWFPFALAGGPAIALLAWLARFVSVSLGRTREHLRGRARPKQHRKNAKRAMSAGDTTAFYASVAAMLHQALDEWLGEPTTGLTHGAIREALAAADDDLADRVIDELDAADFARFSASGASTEELRRTLERADALVTRIGARKPGGAST